MKYLRFSEVEVFEFSLSRSKNVCIKFITKSDNVYYKYFESEESRQKWYDKFSKLDFNNMVLVDLSTIL
jgi:hypothetical protein